MKELKDNSIFPPNEFSKKECKKQLAVFHKKPFELQNLFYADTRFSLLIIIQGIDTSGKDGTIRHVMTSKNPIGVQVKSFKQPTEEELQHDFFWRIYSHFPAKGMIEFLTVHIMKIFWFHVLRKNFQNKIFIIAVNCLIPLSCILL